MRSNKTLDCIDVSPKKTHDWLDCVIDELTAEVRDWFYDVQYASSPRLMSELDRLRRIEKLINQLENR